VDINLGCPAKKSGEVRRLGIASRSGIAGRDFSHRPRSSKDSFDDQIGALDGMRNSIVAVEVAKLAESIGVEAVAVHPRNPPAGLQRPGGLENHRGGENKR